MWTKKDVHIECVYPDESFWLEKLSRVKNLFVALILPDRIKKFYSKTSDSSSIPGTSSLSESSCSISYEPGNSRSIPTTETDGDSAKHTAIVNIQIQNMEKW